jgi:hypothetical protein
LPDFLGDIFSGRPQGPVENIFQTLDNGGVIFSENSVWKEQRHFALQTLRNFGMGRNLMEEKILSSTITMLAQLDDLVQRKKPVEMKWPIQLCVGNIINELLLDFHVWSANRIYRDFPKANRLLFCIFFCVSFGATNFRYWRIHGHLLLIILGNHH